MKRIVVCVLSVLLSGQVAALNESEQNTITARMQSQQNVISTMDAAHIASENAPIIASDFPHILPNQPNDPAIGTLNTPDSSNQQIFIENTQPLQNSSSQQTEQQILPSEFSDQNAPETQPEMNAPEEEPETRFWVLDWSQEFATGYVEKLNDGVDSFFMGAFFDDEIIEDESSGSNGRLYFTTRRIVDQGVDYKVGVNLSLVLPKTRDRFKLLVETDDNEDGEAETDVLNTADNVTYTTAIRIELNDGKRWKNSLDNGVRWEGEPVYFSRLRNRRTDYFYNWRNRFLHSLYWRTDIEWGTRISTNLLHPITDTSHFSAGFNADYILNNDYADLDSNIAVFHQVNRKSAMLYQLAVFGDTERITQVNNYVFSVSYRRKIYRHFVFAEIVPEVAWPRDENFEATPALNFRLEMIFGTHYN